MPTPSGLTKSARSEIVPVPDAVRLALMSMLRWASRVSELALLQLTAALTKMSPLPPGVASVCMVTEVPPSAVCKVVAPMPLVVWLTLPDAMVKSIGSISQLPPPVVTRKPSAITTVAAEVSTNPPCAASVPCALNWPSADNTPASWLLSLTIAVICPPLLPSAVICDALSSCIDFVACKKIRPPTSVTLLALTLPLLRTTTPAIPMRPASAAISPRLVTLPSAPVISTRTPGVAVSIKVTFWPAANIVSPPGVVMMPSLLTALPIRYTLLPAEPDIRP